MLSQQHQRRARIRAVIVVVGCVEPMEQCKAGLPEPVQQQGRVDLSRTPAPREAVEPFQIHVAFGCGGTERLDHNAARHLCVHTEEARVRNEEVGHRVLIELLQDELARSSNSKPAL